MNIKNMGRCSKNLILFVTSYILSNMISGIVYDVYLNYLQDMAPEIANSFWAYYGYATFISALLVLLVDKVGYKWTLVLSPLFSSVGLYFVLKTQNLYVYKIMTIAILVGVQLHYVIMAPFLATYSNDDNKTKWYSLSYMMGYVGWTLTTYLGGLMTVFIFSKRANIDYSHARLLTKNISGMETILKNSYIESSQYILYITLLLSVISIIPIFFINQDKDDFSNSKGKKYENVFVKIKSMLNSKYIISYMVYWVIINFAMGLFTPYITIFLNRHLNIDRSTTALLISISHFSMIIFIAFTPYLVKKLGNIMALTVTVLGSIPFMMIIANGSKFSVGAIGIALFLRSGLANLNAPIESEISMDIASKDFRTLFSTVLNILVGIVSILSGRFTGDYLFMKQDGYVRGYYIASILYFIAVVNIFIVFYKSKYNKGKI